jgi:asparagine synthase (glutamine-hydrolysing)
VPYYGQNDGALVLPLDNCDYHDFRPIVQAVHYLMTRRRRYGTGPWDEDLLWLFGPEAMDAVADLQEHLDLEAENGGYYTLRSETGFLFTRCGCFRHRPGQADMLHVDLWWRGQNIALDAGTYSYNAPAPWNNPLASTVYHNSVTVDGQDQMDRAGKFLWLPWIRGQVHKRSVDDRLTCLLCEHDGYRRRQAPVSYRRAIWRLESDNWLVLDALKSRSAHIYRLHWLLPHFTYEWDEERGRLQLHTPKGTYHVLFGGSTDSHTCTLVTASPMTPHGWWAPYYHYREPALSLDCIQEANVAYYWTFLGPALPSVEVNSETLCVQVENERLCFNLDLFDHPFAIEH